MGKRTYMRVRADNPPGHVRTPYYLRGKIGWIERDLGPFPNPEERAYGHKGEAYNLIRLRFSMQEVWGSEAENPTDTLDAEIYSHWLEPASQPQSSGPDNAA